MRRSFNPSQQSPMATHPPYRDHADVTDAWVLGHLQNGGNSPAETKRLRAIAMGERNLFPVKLHMMLEQTSRSSLESVVSWLPHGRAFKVHNKKRFVQEVMPQYFGNQTKFGSFLRQVSNYGFIQLMGGSSPTAQGSYYHMYCLRGKPVLCRLITCPIVAKSRVRRVFDMTSEPCFDCMPPLPMLGISDALGHVATLPKVKDPIEDTASQTTPDVATRGMEDLLLNLPTVPEWVGPPPAIWFPRNLNAATPRPQPTKVSQTLLVQPTGGLCNTIDATTTLPPTHPWKATNVQVTGPRASGKFPRNQSCFSWTGRLPDSFVDTGCSTLDVVPCALNKEELVQNAALHAEASQPSQLVHQLTFPSTSVGCHLTTPARLMREYIAQSDNQEPMLLDCAIGSVPVEAIPRLPMPLFASTRTVKRSSKAAINPTAVQLNMELDGSVTDGKMKQPAALGGLGTRAAMNSNQRGALQALGLLETEENDVKWRNIGNAKSESSLDLSHDCGSSMESGGAHTYQFE